MALKKYHVSKNLIDFTQSESGGIDASGNYLDSPLLWRSTVYTAIDNTKTYTISYEQITNLSKVRINYYTSNNTHIERQEIDALSVNNAQLSIPNNAAFIKWTLYSTATINISFVASIKIMLNEGSTAEPYEPYGNTWNDIPYRRYETATDVVTNLPVEIFTDGQPVSSYTIKGNTSTSGTPSQSNPVTIDGVGNRTANLFDKDRTQGIIANTYVNQSEQQVSSQSYYLSYPITVTEGETYTWSFNSEYGAQHSAPTVGFYDNSDTLIGVAIHDANVFHFTFTVPNNTSYIRASVYVGAGVPNITPMLIEGTTTVPDNRVMAYIPYGYEISILNNGAALSPVYLTEPLMKIGNYADSLDSSGTVTYNIRKVVVTGEEVGWSQDGTYGSNNRYRLYLSNVKNTGTYITDFYNSHFKVQEGYEANTSVIWYGSSQYVYISVPSSDYPTLTDFKTWLQGQYAAGTPVTVYYLRATPTTETVTVPTIPTTGGEVTLDIDTTVKPSEMSLTYHGWHEHQPKKKSANLFDGTYYNGYPAASTGKYNTPDTTTISAIIPVTGSTTYTIDKQYKSDVGYGNRFTIAEYDIFPIDGTIGNVLFADSTQHTATVTTSSNAAFLCIFVNYATNPVPIDIMVNNGQTALPYVPYWE